MPTPRKYANDAERQRAFRERQKQLLAEVRAAKRLPGPPALSTVPGRLRWSALIEQARAALDAVRQEMEDYIGERSDTWQEGERAADLQQRLDQVAEALSAVEEIELTP